jgi:hypothetical protein
VVGSARLGANRLCMATWRQVQAAIARLAETREEYDKHGRRSWHTGGRSFAWERPLHKSDLKALGASAPGGPVLAVRTADLEMKDAMLGSGDAGLFTMPHFNGYPAVLIALDDVSLATLKLVLVESWLAHAPAPAATAYLAKRRKTKARAK